MPLTAVILPSTATTILWCSSTGEGIDHIDPHLGYELGKLPGVLKHGQGACYIPQNQFALLLFVHFKPSITLKKALQKGSTWTGLSSSLLPFFLTKTLSFSVNSPISQAAIPFFLRSEIIRGAFSGVVAMTSVPSLMEVRGSMAK